MQKLWWDETIQRWRIETHRGDDLKARFVIMALGTASRAKLPGIPGLEDFQGHSFHTSRWDYDYTGGDSFGNLTGLADKRVGIIGTGATAVQCVPHLGEGAKELFVFQRTPSSVDVRNDRPTDPEWAKYQVIAGSSGQAAIYTEHVHHVAIMRKILMRMGSWLNYLFPFH